MLASIRRRRVFFPASLVALVSLIAIPGHAAEAESPSVVDSLNTTQLAKLIASDPENRDYFGHHVSISGDTVVIGAPRHDEAGAESGAAYVYERNAGGADQWGEVVRLIASDAAIGDFFGESVSISGDTIVVGAPGNDDGGEGSGSAYVYGRNAGGADGWGEVVKLTAPDGASLDQFGRSVSISADAIVVGVPGDDDAGSRSGLAYVYGRNVEGADRWGEVAKLAANDATAGDEYGHSVSISGDTVVVGARLDDDAGLDSGSAYVHQRNVGREQRWGQVAKLVATDAVAGDQFSFSISIDGDRIVVGAHKDDDAGGNSGSAYLFERNAGGADHWGEVVKLTASDAVEGDIFGWTVSISGAKVVVGSRYDDDAGDRSGSAYVYERNAAGGNSWGEVVKLTPSDAQAGDEFGSSVSISGDRVLVGAMFGDAIVVNSGAAYAFTVRGCEWAQIAKSVASDAASGDEFGSSVSISGEAAIVGAFRDTHFPGVSESGSAYILDRNTAGADGWGAVVKLTASSTEAGDGFGNSVSISGDTVVVGADRTDAVGSESGSAHVFQRNTGVANNWGEVARLTALDAAAVDRFGNSVSISGDTLVVGAWLNDDAGDGSGSAYVYERNAGGKDRWFQVAKLTASDAAAIDFFGTSVSISGDTIVVGAYGDDDALDASGAAYLYERNTGGADQWGEVTKLTASDAATNDFFGRSVSISEDTVVVGAADHDDAGADSGSAYVYARNAGGADQWGQVAKLVAADAATGDRFGSSVSISGDTIVIGSSSGNGSGSTYVFERNAGGADQWGQVAKLTASDAVAADEFGYSVSIDEGTMIVGARFDDDAGDASGSAYIFTTSCPVCGDGSWEPPEQCDDGNLTDDDGCDSNCTFTACGNGIVTVPEECDDGNLTDGDNCDANCMIECFDADGDGFGLPGDPDCAGGAEQDCDDANPWAWAPPGEVQALTLGPGHVVIEWDPPAVLGGAVSVYVLRSGGPADFFAATCIASDSGTSAFDTLLPFPGATLFYLVRVENACPEGMGSLGRDSFGDERTGRSCLVP